MNPNFEEQPDLRLPPPSFGGENSPVAEKPRQDTGISSPEFLSPIGQTAPVASPVTTSPDPATAAITEPPSPSIPADPSLSSQPAKPADPQDRDRIEKEYVVKAKQIIASTQGDPYAQTKTMNQYRAEVIKRKYDKDIKVTDD
ncbi:MAG TPA: hypothetical protein VMR18_02220 [Candidatus Saccharimonadales bacterium]|jgi:hypothetical protein|nr:hypothetical protein [Candidatus Saccharimonadales bacterium]